MASVVFDSIFKSFGSTKVLHGISLDIADGEFMVLVGPSGCGKSTLLRMLAGLEDISGGSIAIDGRVVNDVESKDRDIAMVFQSYALYPHMTVRENMGFSLRLRNENPKLVEERVDRTASILNRASSPAASASAWQWDAPSCATRRCSCSTSRSPTSTPSCAWRCAPRSRRCTSG
jgi:ABC-type sugar transport system ATPase subunit